MKRILFAFGAAAALTMTGCVMPTGPASTTGSMGGVVMDHTAPGGFAIDNSVKPVKCGKASASGFIIYTTGDNSITAAMEQGGVTKVHHVDYEISNFFNLFSKATTVVWGE